MRARRNKGLCHLPHVSYQCSYTGAVIRYRPWVSVPPMSVSETTVTGYSCSDDYIFSRDRNRLRGMNNSVQLALREAESANSPWQYRTVLTFSCDRRSECYDLQLWFSNFSNYLIGSATFTNLKPNTLYTMVTFPCYQRYIEERICTVNNAFDHSAEVNISTTPLGKTIYVLMYSWCVIHVYCIYKFV